MIPSTPYLSTFLPSFQMTVTRLAGYLRVGGESLGENLLDRTIRKGLLGSWEGGPSLGCGKEKHGLQSVTSQETPETFCAASHHPNVKPVGFGS